MKNKIENENKDLFKKKAKQNEYVRNEKNSIKKDLVNVDILWEPLRPSQSRGKLGGEESSELMIGIGVESIQIGTSRRVHVRIGSTFAGAQANASSRLGTRSTQTVEAFLAVVDELFPVVDVSRVGQNGSLDLAEHKMWPWTEQITVENDELTRREVSEPGARMFVVEAWFQAARSQSFHTGQSAVLGWVQRQNVQEAEICGDLVTVWFHMLFYDDNC